MNKKSLFTVAALFVGIIAVSAQTQNAGDGNADQSVATDNHLGTFVPPGFIFPSNPSERMAAYNAAVAAYVKSNPSAAGNYPVINTAVPISTSTVLKSTGKTATTVEMQGASLKNDK